MSFRRIERSYYTPTGWRLATFEEAKNGLETIKEQGLLKEWDRVRLLDGWLRGPGYNYQMGNDFRSCMGYMLLIQTQASVNPTSGSIYDDVTVSDAEKQVGLFLCVEDWNLELVYWLLNSWAKPETMDIEDVKEGRIPFSDVTAFKEMNKMMCSLAQKLGDLGPIASETAAKSKYSGPKSARNVLSYITKIVKEDQSIMEHFSDFYVSNSFPMSLAPGLFREVASQGGVAWKEVADAFWGFLSENYADHVVEILSTYYCLARIYKLNSRCDMTTITTRERNFNSATSILLYLSYYRCNIVHAPIPHGYRNYCAEHIIGRAAEDAAGNSERFSQILQNNALWRCYEETGNYDLLNKLLICGTRGIDPHVLKSEGTNDILMINRLLDCGADPSRRLKLTKHKVKGSIDYAVKWEDEDLGIECVKSLLGRLDEKQQEELANAADYQKGRTALHRASKKGCARICELLLRHGAIPTGQDLKGKTALHFAVERGKHAVANVFMKHPHITELVDLKDKEEQSPLDIVVADMDIELVAKLLSKSRNPEAYFDKVDREHLLRQSLLNGCVNIVEKLLKNGTKLSQDDCDDEGKTAFHLAAMCDDVSQVTDMVTIIQQQYQDLEKLVAKCDRRGRTALHEAALKGHLSICEAFLDMNPKVINIKDTDGRNPIYDAVKGKQNETQVFEKLLEEYSKKDTTLDDLIDRRGLTPLHVAASQGNRDVVEVLLSDQKIRSSVYLKRGDFLGQTALHMAAKCGDSETLKILLSKGAQPLKERDCDGRTALHYVVQAKTEGDKEELINLLLQGCRSDEEKLLLLWASASGIGTADQNLSDDDDGDAVRKILAEKKKDITETLKTGNLLKIAASMGEMEMTKELISRGYQFADIKDEEWIEKLEPEKQEHVKIVSKQLERIREQGNDQPTISDNLGRIDYAHGLAALFLNPFVKPPIVVGISGSWGMGKSSLMAQTESILLQTAAQIALLPSSKLSSSALNLPEIKTFEFSKKGKKKYEEIKRQMDHEQKVNKNLFVTMRDKIRSWIKKRETDESQAEINSSTSKENTVNKNLFVTVRDKIQSWIKKRNADEPQAEKGHGEQDSLWNFLNNYEVKYRKIFKTLAAMDSTDMFTIRPREDQEHQKSHSKTMWDRVRMMWDMQFTANVQQSKPTAQQSKTDSAEGESVPAILTVQYNAWKYRNETEALAGMAVEITKELEGIMTQAQWLSTCWRNTWKKKKYNIWIEIIFPCLLAVVLACTFTWIVWVMLEKYRFKDWAKAKYACLPAAIVIIGWTLTKSTMGILKPVSTQLMNYISFPDHTDKLGYQERVISDISFLKDEIGKKPNMVFTAFSWVFTAITALWLLITGWWVTSLFSHRKNRGKTMRIPEVAPASGTNLRIIVFIDDLDRCQESVILQVLSAINLVLAVCEINVVLGIDKGLIERAIIRKYGDTKNNKSFKDSQELADKYLQKIIQLPLDLPDPSGEQSRKFLEGQLGVFQKTSEDIDSELKTNARMTKTLSRKTSMPDAGRSRQSKPGNDAEREIVPEIIPKTQVAIDMQNETEIKATTRLPPQTGRETEAATSLPGQRGREAPPGTNVARIKHTENRISNRNSWFSFPIREMLFVRYSEGEHVAFCYFQKLATDFRKLPREWKRLLNYHRLVWYIISVSKEARDLAGWQVQLITWIFICWEWQENLNLIIQNWNKIGDIKTSGSNELSLLVIVDHFIEYHSNKNMKVIAASHEEKEMKETGAEVGISKNKTAETESTNREEKKLEDSAKDDTLREDTGPPLFQAIKEPGKDDAAREDTGPSRFQAKKKTKKKKKKMVRETSPERNLALSIVDHESRKRAGPEKMDNVVKKQPDTLEQTLRKELDDLKKEIKDLKDEVLKQNRRKNEKREEEKRLKLQNWKRLRSALHRYDISMEAIQAFQRFRFYCIAGHLAWPLSKQENEEP